MTIAEEKYHQIADSIPETKKGSMFGALCLKADNNGKAGVMFRKDCMVFKLDGEHLKNALELDGASMFQPAEGRTMNGWVSLPYNHSGKWLDFAILSIEFVKKLKK